MTEQSATTIGWQPSKHSRFELAAPRHFLLPALLLLLAERAQHGYSLAKGAQDLRVGRVDRPSVYRALNQLETDGLIHSGASTDRSGQSRRVYALTDDGAQALRRWMGVIKQERDGLDRVLRRYVATGTVDAFLAEVEANLQSVTALAWSPVSSTSPLDRRSAFHLLPTNGHSDRTDNATAYGSERERNDWTNPDRSARTCSFRLNPERSVVLVEARSSVGPIAFGAVGVTGTIETAVLGQRICAKSKPRAHLEVEMQALRSGNTLYDAELLRRVDARRYPTVNLELRGCQSLGPSGRYRLVGEVTFHGVTRPLDGSVEVALSTHGTMRVRGEQLIDIRDFGIASPTVLMLRMYPDVVVKLQVEAERQA